jgi:hypothetical protein
MGVQGAALGFGLPATLVAITPDDTWAHSAADVDELAAALGGAPPELDFFDVDGRPQRPSFDDGGRLAKLDPTGEPDPAAVGRRLEAVFAHLAQFLEDAGEPVDALPPPSGRAGLSTRFSHLHFTHDGPNDSRGWVHNALHRAGIGHG